jgi:hypothetical protein
MSVNGRGAYIYGQVAWGGFGCESRGIEPVFFWLASTVIFVYI